MRLSSTKIIDVTGHEPVEHHKFVPPRSVVIPGTRPKTFPAREYGVPCIVGTQHGTSMFRTGDRVELDGSTGRLRLLGPDE